MEAVGVVASLITLLATARKLSTDAWEISQAIDQAPIEVRNATAEVCLVGSTLEQVLGLRLEMEDGYKLPIDLRVAFARALQQCHGALKRLEKVCGLEHDGARLKRRLKWALVERKQVDKARSQIAHAESHLLVVMHTLNTRILLLNHRSIGSLISAQSAVSGPCHFLPSTAKSLPESLAFPMVMEGSLSKRLHQSHTTLEVLQRYPYDGAANRSVITNKSVYGSSCSVASAMLIENASWLKHLGLIARCAYYWDSHQSTYSLRLSWKLPKLLGRRAISFETALRFHTLSWSTSQSLYGSLGMPLIVDCSSPLMSACAKGDLDAARDLIESRRANLSDRRGMCHCSLWECRSHEGETALSFAIRSGNIDLVQYLVMCGADVNAMDYGLETPVFMAFHYQHLDIARLLVNKGACLEHVDSRGRTALHMVLGWHRHYNWHRHFSTDWQVNKFNNLLPCLIYLASCSFMHFNTANHGGETPMHMAASCGIPFDAFQAITKFGKHFGVAKQHEAILSDAILGGQRRIINHVLTTTYQHLHNNVTTGQEALLHEAIECNSATEVKKLLQEGANANAAQAQGYTPLHKAIISESDVSIIRMLLAHDADVNATDVRGNTPLHHAVAHNGSGISAPKIRSLLRAGADPHIIGEIGCWASRPPFFNVSYYRFWSIRATAADCARTTQDPERVQDYFAALKEFHPEVSIDKEGDIFWDARGESGQEHGRGGSSYERRRVYNDVTLQKWRTRRDYLAMGALQAWHGERPSNTRKEKIFLDADQYPTIVIYMGALHRYEFEERSRARAQGSTDAGRDATEFWMAKHAAGQPLVLQCSSGPV